MALAQNRLTSAVWRKLRTRVGVRFTRFVGVAGLSLATSEILLSVCDGLLHMTSVPAALISTLGGAAVSYVLSRWAWERKGKPDILRETVPFWVISAMVWVILTLATKFGYHIASWMGYHHGIKHVLIVDLVYLAANAVTFALRFVIFHYVLFADRTTAARAAATGPDAVPPGTRKAPAPGEVPAAAATGPAVPGSSSTTGEAVPTATRNSRSLSRTGRCFAPPRIDSPHGKRPGTVMTVPGSVLSARGDAARYSPPGRRGSVLSAGGDARRAPARGR